MKNPKVDVIIPTYNGLPYLKETIDSVLAQTYQNFDLYVVDDGSTDKGATKKYVHSIKDPRVHYLYKENGGQATARNFGIKKSDSPYITFLDSDDIWFPEKLARQLDLLEKKPKVGMVYGYHHFIDGKGDITGSLVISKRGNLLNDLAKGNCIAGSASMVMARRSVFDDLGLFKEDFLIGEDWEMWLRIAQGYEIDFVPDFLAALRVHDSGMQKNFTKMADGLVYMLPTMLNELELTREQKRTLSETCLSGAIEGYMNSKSRNKARRTLWQLFRISPNYVLKIRNWFGIGLYTRVILGNPLYSAAKKALRQALGKGSIGARTN